MSGVFMIMSAALAIWLAFRVIWSDVSVLLSAAVFILAAVMIWSLIQRGGQFESIEGHMHGSFKFRGRQQEEVQIVNSGKQSKQGWSSFKSGSRRQSRQAVRSRRVVNSVGQAVGRCKSDERRGWRLLGGCWCCSVNFCTSLDTCSHGMMFCCCCCLIF